MTKWNPTDRERILEASKDALVLWDFDGVIADTEPLHEESYRLILARLGYIPKKDFYLPLAGRSDKYIWEEFMRMGVPMYGDAKTFELEKSQTFSKVIDNADYLEPSWIVTDLARTLHPISKRQIILSNGDMGVIISLIEKWDLVDYLEVIQKPNEGKKKELLIGFLESERCVVFEDNAGTLKLSKEAGAFCVGVTHPMFSTSALLADILVPIQ